jgi:hypothetical protein
MEENRVPRRQLDGRRLRVTDNDRCQLAARVFRLGRRALPEIATIVTLDTLLRWHCQLVARTWTYAQTRAVAKFCWRSSAWSCGWRTRIPPGATRASKELKNLGHRVARSTIARILKKRGVVVSVNLIQLTHCELSILHRFARRAVFSAFFASLVRSFRSRATLQLEILALRHQLGVLRAR